MHEIHTKACAGAWSPTLRWTRATGNPPASGRISTSLPLSPACAPRQTLARHPRKGSKHCRFIARARTTLRMVLRPRRYQYQPPPAAKPCPYPISNGPRAHWPQARMRALCRPALVGAITAKRCALRCFERGRASGRPLMTLSPPSLPPTLRGPSRHPFWLSIPRAARPCCRLSDAHGGMVAWQHAVRGLPAGVKNMFAQNTNVCRPWSVL